MDEMKINHFIFGSLFLIILLGLCITGFSNWFMSPDGVVTSMDFEASGDPQLLWLAASETIFGPTEYSPSRTQIKVKCRGVSQDGESSEFLINFSVGWNTHRRVFLGRIPDCAQPYITLGVPGDYVSPGGKIFGATDLNSFYDKAGNRGYINEKSYIMSWSDAE